MMMMILAIMFMGSIQPIMMVVSLILITMFYSFCVMNMMGSFWFSYALMMIMLSGVFVIFVYMASLAPNEEFEIYSLIFLVLFVFAYCIKVEDFFGSGYEYISLKLWLSYFSSFMIFLGAVLFGVMLMVIWVSCKDKGALRVI